MCKKMYKIYLVLFFKSLTAYVLCCNEYFCWSLAFEFSVQEYKINYYLLLPTSESTALEKQDTQMWNVGLLGVSLQWVTAIPPLPSPLVLRVKIW